MFEVWRESETGKTQGVKRLADGAWIPQDLGNKDWRRFLEWNAQQIPPLDLSDGLPPTAAERLVARKTETKAFLFNQDVSASALRCTIKEVVSEINILRDWITQFKAQVALSTSLADLRTRVAGLPNMPARTFDQARAVFNGLVDGE